jgi:hypothetical protein
MTDEEKRQQTEEQIFERIKNRFSILSEQFNIEKINLRIKIGFTDERLDYHIMSQQAIVSEITLTKILDLNIIESLFAGIIKGHILKNMKRLINETENENTDARIFARFSKDDTWNLSVALFVEGKYVRIVDLKEIVT